MTLPRLASLAVLLALALTACRADPPLATTTRSTDYQAVPATVDGIGRAYMGRQIARVMGHQAAGWLGRPGRRDEERTDLLLDLLALRPTEVVADVGAGSGYFTFPIAARVPRGRVLAVDIQPEMLALLAADDRARKLANITPVLGTVDDPRLPAGVVDVALLVDAYHEFDHPREMMAALARSLAPTGRVVLVEYRGEDASVPIKPLHKMTQAQAIRELAAVGLVHVSTSDALPLQHVMTFRRADAPAPTTAPATTPTTRPID